MGTTNYIHTDIATAIEQINERRRDAQLVAHVTNYLQSDIPAHFDQPKPVLYLSRHLPTPNFEFLYFLDITEQFELQRVIGIDSSDKFVAQNPLKKACARMSIEYVTETGQSTIDEFDVVDIASQQGKLLRDVVTIDGQPLISFHTRLFNKVVIEPVTIKDEAAWVSRNYRGDLLEHYKRLLALQIVHGIMFESYPPEEADLFNSYLVPAFEHIQKTFGCKPLIYEHIPHELEMTRDWNAYPAVVADYLPAHVVS